MAWDEIDEIQAISSSRKNRWDQYAEYNQYLQSVEEIEQEVKKKSIYEIAEETTEDSAKINRESRKVKVRFEQHQQDRHVTVQDDKKKTYANMVIAGVTFGTLAAGAALAGVGPITNTLSTTLHLGSVVTPTTLAGGLTAFSQVSKLTGDQATTVGNGSLDKSNYLGRRMEEIGHNYKQSQEEDYRKHQENIQVAMKARDATNDVFKNMWQ